MTRRRKSKWQTFKTPIPTASSGAFRDFAPSGTGLLKYSFRASPGGTCGSDHSSHQQAGGYSGKRNKRIPLLIMLLGITAALIACNLPIVGEVDIQDTQVVSPVEKSFTAINLASAGIALASESFEGNPPEFAVDGDPETSWQSGANPPHWIEIDLGVSVDIEQIRLIIQQESPGATVIKVWGKGPWGDDEYQLMHQFEEQTSDGQILETVFDESWLGIQFIKVETTESVSPVGWSEVEAFPPQQNPYNVLFEDSDEDGVIDQQDWCPETPGTIEDNGC